ncbi:MAG TPA: nitroreductase family deazaflavin-dependent oxidoreductase [Acidimicrobiia bacterium]|nr:nitroreductase family deazaflavin-dependent oxidoreductase [Acidimicrobiia bacterium]
MANAKDVTTRIVTGVHRAVFRVSNGRLANRGYGMPVLELTTTGRKTGKRRSTMLTSPVQDGDKVVLVASYGGDDRHPTWFLNLRDDPKVEITMDGRKRPMRARVASSEEKVALWPRVVAAHKGYAQYQTRTDRNIPLVILEP